jgi:Ser/Thr protein kinase RdoA (MazF antagonist)
VARREIVEYFSDLSGDAIEDEPEPTLRFALDGDEYEIDLTGSEKAALRALLQEFIAVAQPLTPSGRPVTRTKVAATTATIRAWAAAHGHQVPARGAIPRAVREAYDAANP